MGIEDLKELILLTLKDADEGEDWSIEDFVRALGLERVVIEVAVSSLVLQGLVRQRQVQLNLIEVKR